MSQCHGKVKTLGVSWQRMQFSRIADLLVINHQQTPSSLLLTLFPELACIQQSLCREKKKKSIDVILVFVSILFKKALECYLILNKDTVTYLGLKGTSEGSLQKGS